MGLSKNLVLDVADLEPQTDCRKRRSYQLTKRVFDFFFALLLIPFLIPCMTIIALLIKLNSRGPVFFSHKRVGKGGKLFN